MPSVKKEHLSNVYLELNALKLEKEKLQSSIEAKSRELDALRENKGQLESNFVGVRSELDALKAEKKILQSTIDDKNSKLETLKLDKDQLKSSFVKVNSELDAIKVERDHLAPKFKEVNLENEALKAKNEELKSNFLDASSEISKIKKNKEQLKFTLKSVKLKIKDQDKKGKRNKIVFFILSLILIVSLIFLYLNYSKSETELKSIRDHQTVLLDRIKELKSTKPAALPVVTDAKPEVTYTLQLGLFKTLNIDFKNLEDIELKEIKTDKGNIYQLGSFTTYKEATLFKNEIKKMGLKDVFLVPYNKENKRIGIKEALILSNEKEFIAN